MPSARPELSVTAVVPAYNESGTIEAVLAAIGRHSAVREIIVVDDGSDDNTALLAGRAGARVVRLQTNCGKAAALLEGARRSRDELLLLLDADLVGLQERHVQALLQPVLQGRADMAVGLFSHDLLHQGLSFLSGLRVLPRRLVCGIPNLYTAGYGLETLVSRYARAGGMRVEKVILDDLSHLGKARKYGPGRCLALKCRAVNEILRSAARRI